MHISTMDTHYAIVVSNAAQTIAAQFTDKAQLFELACYPAHAWILNVWKSLIVGNFAKTKGFLWDSSRGASKMTINLRIFLNNF